MIADVAGGVREWWAPVLAFAAGVVSFAAPCVLPLVPGYLAFVSGTDEVATSRREQQAEPPDGAGVVAVGAPARTGSRAPLLPMFLFVAGFAIIFTALGVVVGQAPTGWLSRSLQSEGLLRW